MRQIKCEEAVGKTVAAIEVERVLGEHVVIVFTDRTFALIGIRRASYPGESDEQEFDPEFDAGDIENDMLVRAGICTQAELDQLVQERAAVWSAKRRAFDLEELERLKAKYEPT